MSSLGETFETENMPQGRGDFEPIPAGWYTAIITSAETKDTKAGIGKYISIRFDITGPEYAGRVVFGNVTLRNPNSTAEEIGRQQLGDIMRALGLVRLSDTDEMIGHELSIKLKRTESDQYGPGNEVKAFKAMEGRQSAAPAVRANSAPTAPAATRPAAAKAPWQK